MSLRTVTDSAYDQAKSSIVYAGQRNQEATDRLREEADRVFSQRKAEIDLMAAGLNSMQEKNWRAVEAMTEEQNQRLQEQDKEFRGVLSEAHRNLEIRQEMAHAQLAKRRAEMEAELEMRRRDLTASNSSQYTWEPPQSGMDSLPPLPPLDAAEGYGSMPFSDFEPLNPVPTLLPDSSLGFEDKDGHPFNLSSSLPPVPPPFQPTPPSPRKEKERECNLM